MQFLTVADVILVAVLFVTVDDKSEDVFDGIPVTVEGGARQRDSLAHLRLQPQAVDFGEGDGTGVVDGVHQPDVFAEQGWRLHRAGASGFLSQALGLLALGLEEAVYEVYLLAVGAHDERGAVGELHGGGLGVVERGPVGQSLAVGVAGLGKVYPVLLDDFGDGGLGGIFSCLGEEEAVQVHDVVGMGHAAATGVLREAAGGGLCQVGGVGSAVAGLGLQAYPCVGGPCEADVAEGVAVGVEGFVVGVAGIYFQGFVGHVAEHHAGRLLVVLGLDVAGGEEDALVGVGHGDDGHVVVLAALVEPVLVVGDDIAVDAGPEAAEAHVTVAEGHGVHLAQLLEVLLLEVPLEGEALLLGSFLRGVHAQRAWLVGPWGKRASALADAAVEESAGQR